MKIDPEQVFAKVEVDRLSGALAEKVTTARVVYRATDRQGIIEQVDRATGQRTIGASQTALSLTLMNLSGQERPLCFYS